MRATVAKSVKGSDASAEKRGGLYGIEPVRHLRNGFCGGDHVFGIAAVVGDATDFLVDTIDEIAAAAWQAGSVMAAVPADADALALLPNGDARADFIDNAGDFVAGRTRIGYAGPEAVLDEVVAEADAARLHADADLSCGRLGNVAFL